MSDKLTAFMQMKRAKCAKTTVILDKSSSKSIHPAKKWGFTLNNYTVEDICAITKIIKSYCRFGIFAKEVAPETGTEHLQGYFELRKKARPMGIFKLPRMHFDKKHANRAYNVQYCEKEGLVVFRHPTPYSVTINEFYDWEIDLIKILKQPINERKIYWYWEDIGNAGKTTFMKYIYTNYKRCVVMSGRATDMKNGIVTYLQNNNCLPEIILIDIPRAVKREHISIPGIEEIKNMFFYSGKYEGGMVCGKPPHMIIMSNEPPDRTLMSEDRWVVRNIAIEDTSLDEEKEEEYAGFGSEY